ncbi:MAG: J domain-containing protein [Alphaproteobacteria bacterium]|nr:J domain-containing protein [Alphaproteobacteria bacterium]MDA7983419.1 J domain-containing protein [Alphaproteobacteria bacterium]MDA7989005.1 J domain-containing protein [Alphaproteobacteria bacterium]MDA8010369.1 J domain-containing protein [Alphaproteobacteria bacterium]
MPQHKPLFASLANPPEPCAHCDNPALQHVPAKIAAASLGSEPVRIRHGQRTALCLQHLQEYNKHQQETTKQIRAWEAVHRSDAIWNRPSWPRTRHAPHPKLAEELLRQTAALGHGAYTNSRHRARRRARPLPPRARAALGTLGLGPAARPAEIRRRYRSLVKQLHPDSNPANHDEPRLKAVNRAWQDLKPFLKSAGP